MIRWLPTLAVVAALSCGGLSSISPPLGAVLSRVDVPRLLQCAESLPDYGAAARCLGAQALTQGLKAAIDAAIPLAERAQHAAGPTGAADTTPDERRRIAEDLDMALGALALEIDAASGASD